MKRLYAAVRTTESPDGFAVALDDRPIKTPGRLALILPTRALADAIGAEWRAQGETVRPETMPLMQLAATALDHIPANREAVRSATLRFAETDTVCYRADQPAELVRLQCAAWRPLLDWLQASCGAALAVTTGVLPRPQPAEALAILKQRMEAMDDWRLTAFQAAAASSGSYVIALALIQGRIDADEAFLAAELESGFEIDRWGEDAASTARRAIVAFDLKAARGFHDLLDART